jgi:hypothetical protein
MGNTAKARHRRRYRLLHDKQGGRVTWIHQDWAPRFRAYLDRVWGGDYRAWAVSWAADAGDENLADAGVAMRAALAEDVLAAKDKVFRVHAPLFERLAKPAQPAPHAEDNT